MAAVGPITSIKVPISVISEEADKNVFCLFDMVGTDRSLKTRAIRVCLYQDPLCDSCQSTRDKCIGLGKYSLQGPKFVKDQEAQQGIQAEIKKHIVRILSQIPEGHSHGYDPEILEYLYVGNTFEKVAMLMESIPLEVNLKVLAKIQKGLAQHKPIHRIREIGGILLKELEGAEFADYFRLLEDVMNASFLAELDDEKFDQALGLVTKEGLREAAIKAKLKAYEANSQVDKMVRLIERGIGNKWITEEMNLDDLVLELLRRLTQEPAAFIACSKWALDFRWIYGDTLAKLASSATGDLIDRLAEEEKPILATLKIKMEAWAETSQVDKMFDLFETQIRKGVFDENALQVLFTPFSSITPNEDQKNRFYRMIEPLSINFQSYAIGNFWVNQSGQLKEVPISWVMEALDKALSMFANDRAQNKDNPSEDLEESTTSPPLSDLESHIAYLESHIAYTAAEEKVVLDGSLGDFLAATLEWAEKSQLVDLFLEMIVKMAMVFNDSSAKCLEVIAETNCTEEQKKKIREICSKYPSEEEITEERFPHLYKLIQSREKPSGSESPV